MGQSPNASIGFGYAFPDGTEFVDNKSAYDLCEEIEYDDTELCQFAEMHGLGFESSGGEDQEPCVFIKSTKMNVDWNSAEVISESTFCPHPASIERLKEFCDMLGVPQEKGPGVFVIVTYY